MCVIWLRAFAARSTRAQAPATSYSWEASSLALMKQKACERKSRDVICSCVDGGLCACYQPRKAGGAKCDCLYSCAMCHLTANITSFLPIDQGKSNRGTCVRTWVDTTRCPDSFRDQCVRWLAHCDRCASTCHKMTAFDCVVQGAAAARQRLSWPSCQLGHGKPTREPHEVDPKWS